MKAIEGQVMYMGPTIPSVGLYYSTIFREGVDAKSFPDIAKAIEFCPSIGSLIVPVDAIGAVLQQLKFDYAHNMRGQSGSYVTLYREIQRWLAERSQPKKQPKPSGVTMKQHHA